ncbi:DUF1838 family protein [Sandaracinobacteroides hominis]|uniref:DUF1838 family protein n=1 Tax=Sandaracinobacteroides hominis TaxID=2780086 RepID=UPI0018F7A3CE|nr:DUF1838 family protein [Sandaracinobacteroides hominis]
MGFELKRRDALLAAAGVGAVALARADMADAKAVAGPATMEQQLRAYILMRGALDDRVVTGWAHARYFGMVDAEATPLFDVYSATFTRYRPAAAGGFEAVGAEFAFFTDSEGKVLDTFRNPYTGERVTIPVGGLPPSKLIIQPNLKFKLGRDVPGLEFDHHIEPAVVRGNDIWFNEVTHVVQPAPPGGKAFRYNEVLTMHAPLDAVMKRGALAVQSEVSFTIACSWRPWLKLGDKPGHMMCVGIGRMNGSPDSLPPEWVAGMKAKRPKELADPKAVLAPVWDARPAS